MRREPASAGTIEAFTRDGYRVGGVAHRGAIIVTAGGGRVWAANDPAALTAADFAGIDTPLLILGTGPTLLRPAPALLAALAARGIAVEPMDSRAAARTYNLLLSEGREVAAALLPL